MIMRAGLGLGALLGVIVLAGCSHEPEGPTAGTLSVSLATPNSDDGAVLFTLSGGPVGSVEAIGYSVYSGRIDPNTLRIIVTGNLVSGTIARIRIADNREASRYSATINQVAARSSYAQRNPASYSLSLAP
jgi:hypothetical protein